jgi:hypothetical protein
VLDTRKGKGMSKIEVGQLYQDKKLAFKYEVLTVYPNEVKLSCSGVVFYITQEALLRDTTLITDQFKREYFGTVDQSKQVTTCYHTWRCDYTSAFIKKDYYSCAKCGMKQEDT